jgi:hypothetical protein
MWPKIVSLVCNHFLFSTVIAPIGHMKSIFINKCQGRQAKPEQNSCNINKEKKKISGHYSQYSVSTVRVQRDMFTIWIQWNNCKSTLISNISDLVSVKFRDLYSVISTDIDVLFEP